ncbi:tol-pal system protein YbgF [Guyparkeria hydrothermalis]|uniref:tol-pal system protein YbgF n=1 Tax=Guyparkeria hydrothermalis TaxID=923 RepID=UPI002021A8BE|nr:tol-pal system protein YbgF [Guyparkeria hydrothermalis]MCL7750719.1 tol-pal system protein YbgF [Guyparkeria hydrothermalis]
MQTKHFTKRTPLAAALVAALVAALFAGGTALPAAAQQAPGWLNWGGGSDEPAAEEDDAGSAPSAQATPMPATSVTVADTGSQSGQAVLLQRLMQRVDELERQVQGMRGQLSEQERTIERQQRRLDEVEQTARSSQPAASSGASAAIDRGDPVGQDVPDEAVAAVDGNGGDESDSAREASESVDQTNGQPSASAAEQQALYNDAFEVLKSGKYEQAIDAFQKVIDANPQGEWAASAFFWQGETYYVQQDYAAAGKAYGEVIERFPESSRVPDAKLKRGYVAQELGDNEAARRLFNEILDQYPDSQAAGLAKQRLSRLGNG